jgi:outer membrane usher protein
MQQGSAQQTLQVQRSLPVGTGMGYRLLAGAGNLERREASLSLQNDIGTYVLEAAQTQGETAYRASASGGVAVLGGNAFLSRSITDSFAVVQVPDYPNVRVYTDNQLITHTNAAGSALLPRLRPYQNNPIRIEQADLPLDAQIDEVQLNVVPYFRSGLVLNFPVKRSRGALITVRLESGELLPAGAIARIDGQQEKFPAALRGEIYLSNLESRNQLQISWQDQSCEFEVVFPETAEPVPNLGTYLCEGVKP